MATYTPEQIYQVRVLVPDTEAVFDGQTLFTDDEIDTYLTIGNGNILRAAAYAILAVASSEAIISKVIKTQDLSTSGAQVADALRLTAKELLARADTEESKLDEFYLDFIDYGTGTTTPELTEWNWWP